MKKYFILFLLLFLFVSTINDAYAYIRPGAGNDLIQIIMITLS